MRFQGLLYRGLNPVYARDPLSGLGAARYGGRFNPRGVGAFYSSLSPQTALKEVNQVGTLQPTTLVAYRADIEPVFDTRDIDALQTFGVTQKALATPAWRDQARAGAAPTQAFAVELVKAGYAGLLIQSFAPGATASDLSLVLWRWGSKRPTLLKVVDDESRLGRG